MKQKIYSLLLMAVFGWTGMNAWAQDYEIGNAADLLDFATAVNGGETAANAILTANIDLTGETWTPIGNADNIYTGTFDGQGYAITGFSYTATSNYNGLFGFIKDATVKNFSISGELISDGFTKNGVIGNANGTSKVIGIRSALNITVSNFKAHTGGIVGGDDGGTTDVVVVEDCEYSGTMTHSGAGDCQAGILGYTGYGGVKNCIFSGTIIGENNKYGGILGYSRRPNFVGVQNCLSIGKIVANEGCQTAAAIIANFNGGATTNVKNNYYCLKEGSTTTIAIGNLASSCEAPHAVTATQLANGEVAFLLNENVNGGENWFQKLKTMTFYAEQYVLTANGTEEAPTTADIILSDAGDGTFIFTLPNFVLKILGQSFPVGTISSSNIEIDANGNFSSNDNFSVPDENIPAALNSYADKFKNIPYTLTGKVNDENDKFYAEIDLTVMSFPINVKAGIDDFTAAAPTGEAYPTPYGTAKVYTIGRLHCNGDLYDNMIYTNEVTEAPQQDGHNYENGFCSYCSALDESYDGIFEIANAIQLKSFSTFVNENHFATNAVLVADIDLTDVILTPIGNGTAYTGTFDGQGHAISNFSMTTNASKAGLFGIIGGGAVVKNFTIDGTINSTGQRNSVIGSAEGNATISGIHSKINLTCTQTRHGGVLGAQSADGTVNIDGCTYSGTLTITGNVTGNFGGIVGLTHNSTSAYVNISNCLFDGTIDDGTGDNAGGIVGYTNGTKVTVSNCLSKGSITATHPGQIFGQLNGKNSKCEGKNYYVAGDAVGNLKSGVSLKGTTPETVTTEQLASGEVAFNLGEAWSQLLDTDAYPVPGSSTPVFYVGAAGYATMYDTVNDWALNGDAQAYIAAAEGQNLKLTAIDDIPAGTAVILKGTYYNKLAATATSDVSANELLGTDAETAADGTMYILAKPEGKEVGFYQAEGTIPAGKAYYKSTSSGVKPFFFSEDDATGIAGLKDLKDSKDLIYNVAGQRMQKMQRGINIVGGKKVLY